MAIINDELFDYEGDVLDGMPHGEGHMTYKDDDYFIEYEGSFLNGKEHGKGRQVTSEGTYEGDFVEGRPKGIGRFYYPEGDIYEGEFDFVPEGKGEMRYADGSCLKGFFVGGYPEGKGILTEKDGKRYDAEYADGELIGKSEIEQIAGCFMCMKLFDSSTVKDDGLCPCCKADGVVYEKDEKLDEDKLKEYRKMFIYDDVRVK